MISNRVLKYTEILFTIWTVLFGLAGILAVGGGDGKNIPPVAWDILIVMAICACIVYLTRKIRQERDREEFLDRHPELRRTLY